MYQSIRRVCYFSFLFCIIFVFCCYVQGCRPKSAGISTGTMKVHRVSLVRLISSPNDYHGRVVYVAGYLVLEHEGNALYLDELQYQHKLLNNAIWLETNKTFGVECLKLNKQYVEVLATFDSDDSRDQTMYSGKLREIRSVTRVER